MYLPTITNHKYTSNVGGDGASGADMTVNSYATSEKIMESLAVDSVGLVMRDLTDLPSSNINLFTDGTSVKPKTIMAWPRPDRAAVGDFVQGSDEVTNVDVSLSERAHTTRPVVGPDGKEYWIPYVSGASTLKLNRLYAGANASGAGFTIQKDTDYDWAQTLGAPEGANDKATWNAVNDNMPVIDFDDGNFNLLGSGDGNWVFKNFYFKDSTDAQGIFSMSVCQGAVFEGCIFEQSLQNDRLLQLVQMSGKLIRCVFIGSNNGASTAQHALSFNGSNILLDRVAFRDISGSAINISTYTSIVECNDVLLGVHGKSLVSEIKYGSSGSRVFGGMSFNTSSTKTSLLSTTAGFGYRNILGINNEDYTLKDDSTEIVGIGVVSRNLGTGADINLNNGLSVLETLFDQNANRIGYFADSLTDSEGLAPLIATLNLKNIPAHEQTLVIPINAEEAQTAAQIRMQILYKNSYTGATIYTETILVSTDTIDARANASDWTQELRGVFTPAFACDVQVKLFQAFYHATSKTYWDVPTLNGVVIVDDWQWVDGIPQLNWNYFDEAARNTTPGESNVLTSISWEYLGVTQNGSFDEAARNTGTAAGNILTGNSIKIQNVTTNGTFDEDARNVDPGIAKVQDSQAYKIQNIDLIGTLAALPVPSAPTFSIAATSGSTTQLTVSIDFNSTATKHQVDYSTDNAAWTTFDNNITSNTSTITGLASGTLYYVRVRSANGTGFGSYATAQTATTGTSATDLAITTLSTQVLGSVVDVSGNIILMDGVDGKLFDFRLDDDVHNEDIYDYYYRDITAFGGKNMIPRD